MHNTHGWIYQNLEGITGGTTAAIYGFISFEKGLDEALFRIGVALVCGFVGAAGAWIFKKLIDKL